MRLRERRRNGDECHGEGGAGSAQAESRRHDGRGCKKAEGYSCRGLLKSLEGKHVSIWQDSRITRRELLREAGAASMLALGAPAAFADAAEPAAAPAAQPGSTPEEQAAEKYRHPPGVFINRPLTQVPKAAEALLDDMEGRNCDFFYNEASPKTGLVRDRAPSQGRSLSRVSSIAATGFGLSAMCIARKRHYLRPKDCEQRVEKTLAFLLNDCPHEHGFLYHFIDIDSGQRMFASRTFVDRYGAADVRHSALPAVFRRQQADRAWRRRFTGGWTGSGC